MTLDEIDELWKEDCKIDEANLVKEGARIPKLHHKYYMHYIKEGLRVKKLKADLKVLQRDKYDWLIGAMAEEDLKERGWKPNPRKILRTEVDKYLDADKDIIELSLKIDYFESIHKFLEDIVRQIAWRNNVIGNMIQWAKFTAGAG